jgi:hypothetical protein
MSVSSGMQTLQLDQETCRLHYNLYRHSSEEFKKSDSITLFLDYFTHVKHLVNLVSPNCKQFVFFKMNQISVLTTGLPTVWIFSRLSWFYPSCVE